MGNNAKTKKLNCWDIKKCGREAGGSNVKELGVRRASVEASCSGYNDGQMAGRMCWAVAGTFCEGKVQGTFASKILSCLNCEVLLHISPR